MKNLSQNEKTFLAICIGWAFLHVIFLAIGWEGDYHETFWPFEAKISLQRGQNAMSETYDISEFLVYAGGPAVAFFIHRLINDDSNRRG